MDYRPETFPYSFSFPKDKNKEFSVQLLASKPSFFLAWCWIEMWCDHSHLSRTVVILWSRNSPLSLINVDGTPELAGISLLLIYRGFQSHLRFSSMKVYGWKVLAAYSSGYFGYPSWITSIPRRTSSSVPCCLCPALSLTCYKTLLKIFV